MNDAVITERRRFIINCGYFACIAALVFVAFRYAIYVIMPFLIAFLVAMLLKPAVGFLERRLHLKRSIGAFIMTILFYGTVGVLLTLLGIRIVVSVRNLLVSLPDIYTNDVLPTLDRMFDGLENAVNKLSPEAVAAINQIGGNLADSVGTFISDTSNTLVNTLTKYATGIPGLLIDTIITIISTFFFALDYSLVTGFIAAQLPDKAGALAEKVREGLGATLTEYTKSYALIMFITFLEILIGLSVIEVKSAVTLAVLIAVFDILPIIGSGMILFPWTVITLAQGDIQRGIGLGVLWLVVVVVRQVIEPKIIGDRVGLHPIVTLMAMIVGAALFGGFGLLGLPVAVAIIKRLHDEGTIKLYNSYTVPQEPKRPKKRRRGKSAEADEPLSEQSSEPTAEPTEPSGEPDVGESGGGRFE